jgi:beta-N-acetylhexosaminidase
MTAHICFPAVDVAPATLSPVWMRILRDELGFDGVVISDALDMAAVAQGVGRGEGAVRALLAGVDLLCTGSPEHPRHYDDRTGLAEVYDAVLAAATEGRLQRARLEQAAYRVRDLGADLAGRRRVTAGQTDPGAQVLARDVLLAVVEVRGRARLGDGDPVVVDLRTAANIAAGGSAPRLTAVLRRRRPGTIDAVGGDAAAVSGPDGAGRPVVAIVDAPHRHPAEREQLAVLLAARPDTVVVQTGLGDDRPLPAHRWVRTWGAGHAHAEVVADLLLGPAGAP